MTTPPIYGNYHGYYSKRPNNLQLDPRISLLPESLFENKVVLDVGCNEGRVTCEIAQLRRARKVVGVDIDETLISAAWRRRRTVWSLQEPLFLLPPSSSDASSVPPPRAEEASPSAELSPPQPRKRRRAGSSSEAEIETSGETLTANTNPVANYFPASCEHEFGSLPIPPYQTHEGGKDVFPHNVVFRTVDWVADDVVEDGDGYDVVLAFSISKWIHLNSGDAGLKTFFQKVHRVLKPEGYFVLEPQPWDTYAKAKRMSEKLKENAKHLQLRPEADFERILTEEMGFELVEHFGFVGEGGFRRPVDLYRKKLKQVH